MEQEALNHPHKKPKHSIDLNLPSSNLNITIPRSYNQETPISGMQLNNESPTIYASAEELAAAIKAQRKGKSPIHQPEVTIIQRAESSIRDFISGQNKAPDCQIESNNSNRQNMQNNNNRRWIRPDPGELKANSDANHQEYGSWGLGAIIRNENGLAMASATWKRTGFNCAATAEAYGMLNTMRLSVDCGFRRMIFENDNEKVVQMLKRGDEDDRTYLESIHIHLKAQNWSCKKFKF